MLSPADSRRTKEAASRFGMDREVSEAAFGEKPPADAAKRVDNLLAALLATAAEITNYPSEAQRVTLKIYELLKADRSELETRAQQLPLPQPEG